MTHRVDARRVLNGRLDLGCMCSSGRVCIINRLFDVLNLPFSKIPDHAASNWSATALALFGMVGPSRKRAWVVGWALAGHDIDRADPHLKTLLDFTAPSGQHDPIAPLSPAGAQ